MTRLDQCSDACTTASATQTLHAGFDQNAVIEIKRHEIGHRSQRHQVQKRRQIRLFICAKATLLSHMRAQGKQHVEHYANASERLAGKVVAMQVGIDDGIRRRQLLTRKMMIRDDNAHAARTRGRHASQTCDAVVDGHDELRVRRQRCNELRRKSVTVHEAIRHDVIHATCTKQSQPTHGNGRASCAITVVIAGDHDGCIIFNGLRQQSDGMLHATQLLRRE